MKFMSETKYSENLTQNFQKLFPLFCIAILSACTGPSTVTVQPQTPSQSSAGTPTPSIPTPAPSATATPTSTPTPTASPTPSATPTPTPAPTPAPSPTPSHTAQVNAVLQTVASNAMCSQATLGDYYYEIGDASSGTTPLVSGQVGTTYSRDGVVQLDSASKMIYGSFVVQSKGGIANLTADDIVHLHQQSGFNNMPANCSSTGSVLSCLQENPGQSCPSATAVSFDVLSTSGMPVTFNIASTDYGALCSANVGLFHYNGANFQSQAALDMPSTFYNATTTGANSINTQLNSVLGLPSGTLNYYMPLLAGGIAASPAGVATLLQKIIAPTNPLLMNAALGTNSVCTNPGGNYAGQTIVLGSSQNGKSSVTKTTTVSAISAPNGPWISNGICNATYSPIPENWQYSIGHWVETDVATNGDGAFSSPGAKGFVPWISADKSLYGIIARVSSSPGAGGISEQCGRLLRHAYVTGIAQTGTIPTR